MAWLQQLWGMGPSHPWAMTPTSLHPGHLTLSSAPVTSMLMNSKRLSDSLAAASAMIGAMASSAAVGVGGGFLVTVVWFGNTRSDGLRAFLITAIAAGLFASVVAYVLMVCRHHIPSPYTVLTPALPWLIAAIYVTWTTCEGSFITAHNVLWILKSGDDRNFELGWVINGWVVVITSLVAAIITSRWLLTRRRAQSVQSPTAKPI
jgi:hypothetical protein